MRKSELDRLLETAVADALGLTSRRARTSKVSKSVPRATRRPAYQAQQHSAQHAAH